MIIKNIGNIESVKCPNGGFESFRFLLENDKMGFTITKTVISPMKGEQFWHYKNHLEACLCISGYGRLVNIETDESYTIEPGTMYALDKNDAHTFEAYEEVVLICVFNPPLTGKEVHKNDGSYEVNNERI